MTRVLLAPDKFKGSATASQVVDALAHGISSVRPDWDIARAPVADGGDGTVAAAVSAGWDEIVLDTTGPTGEPVVTSYARRGDTIVVELASTVGLSLLPGGLPNPLGATTYGLGTVVAHARRAGARSVVIGLGGSASTDGGAGMMQALGVRILDRAGSDVPPGGTGVCDVDSIDLTGLLPEARSATFALASDVDNPLLGPTGATAVYARQKGASDADLLVLERAMATWSSVVRSATGRDVSATAGAGAAGGTGYGALALLGATVRPGIDVVLDLVDFDTHLATADLVVTGEGSLDEQSLHGKAPIGVATRARRAGVPVVTVSGRNTLDRHRLRDLGIVDSYALTDLEPDPATSMRTACALLHRIGHTIATRTIEGTS